MATWRVKAGKKAHHHGGRRYEPGEPFEGPEDLGERFDKLELVSTGGRPRRTRRRPVQKLVAKHRGGKYWDVVNSVTEKLVNDAPLIKEEAFAMVAPENRKGTEDGQGGEPKT